VSLLRQMTTSSEPLSILKTLRADLKSAMQNKDMPRLNVIKSILTDITNSQKTSQPLNTEIQLLALLRKKITASESARDEFMKANRNDLVDKEDLQLKSLNEFSERIKVMGEEEIKGAVGSVIDTLEQVAGKMNAGDVLKKLFETGGLLDGKTVERGKVAVMVKQLLQK